jgi:hypothetical protein
VIPINWKAFAKRFDGCEQTQFEKLALLHFCHSFGMPRGVFRYVNHPNIETEPTVVGQDVVAFQAKYYSDKISSHKQELIDAITDAKARYPQLTKLLFYINQDHTCNSRGGNLKPAYLIEIENCAAGLGISLMWMTKGKLEVVLSQPDCEFIAQYFFAENEGLPELIRAIEERTSDLLNSIHDEFDRVDGVAAPSVDRRDAIGWIKATQSGEVAIVSGLGGGGKSATVKLFWRQLARTSRLAYFHFDVHSALRFLSVDALSSGWKVGLDQLLTIYEGLDQRWLVLDSIEHLEGSVQLGDLLAVIRKFQQSGWRIVLTTRGLYESSLVDSLTAVTVNRIRTLRIDPLSSEQVGKILSAFNIQSHHWRSIESALRLPFNLSLYLRHGFGKSPMESLEAWRDAVWTHVIEGGSSRVSCGETFCALIRQKLTPGFRRFDTSSLRADDLDALCRRGVLVRYGCSGRLEVGHDIYEEWALVRIMNERFEDAPEDFPSCLDGALPMRRAYRLWMYDNLGNGWIDDAFVRRVLAPGMRAWREETVLALLQWKSLGDFLSRNQEWFLRNGASELIAFLKVVQVVGRVRRTKLGNLGLDVKQTNPLSYLFTEPAGSGWNDLICFIARHIESVGTKSYDKIVEAIEFFSQSFHEGVAAQAVNHCALHFAKSTDQQRGGLSYRYYKRVASVISNTAKANVQELGDYLRTSLAKTDWQDLVFFGEYAETIVADSPLHTILFETFPRECEQIFAGIITFRPEKHHWVDFCTSPKTGKAGLRDDVDSLVRVGSAYATPAFYLLKFGGRISFDFLVQVLNDFFEKYCSGRRKVQFVLPDGKVVALYEGLDLWTAHRVMVGALLPHVIVCILMAFEKYALKLDADESLTDSENWCLDLLSKANSVAIPGLLTSVVLKYKWKFMRLALTLFSCREALAYDLQRSALEGAKLDFNFYGRNDPCESFYRYDRDEVKNEAFRKESLEFLIFTYQMVREGINGEVDRVNRIWAILDGFYGRYERLPPEELCFRSRVDIREVAHWEKRNDDKGHVGFVPIPRENEEVTKLQEDNKKSQRPINLGLGLQLWSLSVLQPELSTGNKTAVVSNYEANPDSVVNDLEELRVHKQIGADDFLRESVVVETCAALLKARHRQLNDSQLKDYEGVVLSAIAESYWAQKLSMALSSRDRLLSALLVVMAETDNKEVQHDIRVALLLFLISDYPTERVGPKSAFAVVQASCLSAYDRVQLVRDYVRLKRAYLDFSKASKPPHRHRTVRDFVAEAGEEVEAIIKSPVGAWTDIEPYLDGEMLCEGLVLLSGDQMDAEGVDFVLRHLSQALEYLYTPKSDGDVRFNSVHGVRTLVLRCLAPWMLKASGIVREKVAEALVATPHIFEVSDVLDEFAICAETLQLTEAFSYYWGRFAMPVCTSVSDAEKELIPAYTLTAYYWRTDLHPEPSKLVTNSLLAVYKRVFDMLKPDSYVVSCFSRFFATKGSTYCVQGLLWIAEMLPNLDCRDRSVRDGIDELLLKVQELHRVDIIADKKLYDKMLAVLDYQVASGSVCSFQIRETF